MSRTILSIVPYIQLTSLLYLNVSDFLSMPHFLFTLVAAVDVFHALILLLSEYFSSGMGIAEAMTFHRNRLEMSDDFTESVLADATKNPKYRTVVYWHTTWLQFTTADLGPLTQSTVTSVCVQSITLVE
jgi:hypothetical protein